MQRWHGAMVHRCAEIITVIASAAIILWVLFGAGCWYTSPSALAWRSWWRCNWQATAAFSLFVVSGVILIVALANDCRYSCQQWQSIGLDILATFASFSMGLVLMSMLNSQTESRSYWKQTLIWVVTLGVFLTVLILSPLVESTRKNSLILIWTLALPVLGVAGKSLWPRLFEDRCNRR